MGSWPQSPRSSVVKLPAICCKFSARAPECLGFRGLGFMLAGLGVISVKRTLNRELSWAGKHLNWALESLELSR